MAGIESPIKDISGRKEKFEVNQNGTAEILNKLGVNGDLKNSAEKTLGELVKSLNSKDPSSLRVFDNLQRIIKVANMDSGKITETLKSRLLTEIFGVSADKAREMALNALPNVNVPKSYGVEQAPGKPEVTASEGNNKLVPTAKNDSFQEGIDIFKKGARENQIKKALSDAGA